MATLTTADGRHRIQFFDRDGKRRSVSLGSIPKKSANTILTRIEDLAHASITGGAPHRETSHWLDGLGQSMKRKLADVGLIDPPDDSSLKPFIDEYVASRTDLKQSTREHIERAGKTLTEFLGASKPLRDVTPGDADRWRLSMLAGGLGKNTVARRVGRAKQLFRAAIRKRLIDSNPFTDLESVVHSNAERFVFVDKETIERVIDAAPCAEWRLLIALARYGGLRTPSEPLALRWADVDWERQRLRVTAPKTEHHAGKGVRTIPIFPELKPYIDEAWELADENAEFIITRYRSAKKNLRTHFIRIMGRAGVDPWEKPWQNLRASRETELSQEFPLHVVTTWMGNSQPVAMKHYLHVLDADFERALTPAEKACAISVQQASANGSKPEKRDFDEHEKTPEFPGSANDCEIVQNCIDPRAELSS